MRSNMKLCLPIGNICEHLGNSTWKSWNPDLIPFHPIDFRTASNASSKNLFPQPNSKTLNSLSSMCSRTSHFFKLIYIFQQSNTFDREEKTQCRHASNNFIPEISAQVINEQRLENGYTLYFTCIAWLQPCKLLIMPPTILNIQPASINCHL